MSHPVLSVRSSGLLLHPTSLASPHGLGDLGAEARAFIEFARSAGQTWWQMLPVTPPAGGDSPYGASSAFAGSPLLIDLRGLVADGFLRADELPAEQPTERADFSFAHTEKILRLEQAYRRKADVLGRKRGLAEDLEEFEHREATWLDDYALFAALHRAHAERPWTEWDHDVRDRSRDGLKRARRALAGEIAFHRFSQWLFDRQWRALKRHAVDRQVRLMGDLPIFVAHDSADVWSNRELFLLDRQGHPRQVAGVPPDYFSEDGQLWGNPLYDWRALAATGYRWWVDRFRALFERFDAVRVDHFIGFHRAWHIPAGAKTAKVGRWKPGPRAQLFRRLEKKLGALPILAEDLGAVTPAVWALRDQFGFPGMRVLQFAFGEPGSDNEHQPHLYPANAVVYTGTHDNDTISGWYASLGKRIAAGGKEGAAAALQRQHLLLYLDGMQDDLHWSMIRLVMLSAANTAIFPVQDVLGLGAEARMNVPGTAKGNWGFRLSRGALTEEHSARLSTLTTLYGRAPRASR